MFAIFSNVKAILAVLALAAFVALAAFAHYEHRVVLANIAEQAQLRESIQVQQHTIEDQARQFEEFKGKLHDEHTKDVVSEQKHQARTRVQPPRAGKPDLELDGLSAGLGRRGRN